MRAMPFELVHTACPGALTAIRNSGVLTMKKQILFVSLIVLITTMLDHQATHPDTKNFFAHLRDGDKWAVRDDVFIKFLARKGPLTIGYNSSYRNMMVEVKDVFDNCETVFPELKAKKLELAGFVWFQGFNDMFGDWPTEEYASNMTHFIKDVRKDLYAPKLPFVIAAIGNNGSKPAKGGILMVQNAQLSINDVPEFKGNVKTFP